MSNVTKLKTLSQRDEEERASKGIIFILDDDPSIRSAYQRLFDFEGFLAFPYDSAEAFLLRYEEAVSHLSGPRCLLCDVGLPGISGLSLQQEIAPKQSTMPFIFMSGISSEVEVVQAYREGGFAFMLKPIDIDELLDTVQSALRLSWSRQEESREADSLRSLILQLTDRERSVIRLVLHGYTNPQISERLHIALRTVKVHRQHAMEKLGVSNLVELTRLADRSEL